jgi:Ca2+-binding RTX toxin-like protein
MMVDAGAGDDRIYTASGNDFVAGGPGIDRINTFGGDDVIDPGTGDDNCDAGTGSNTLDYSARPVAMDINLDTSAAGPVSGGERDEVRSFSRVNGGSGDDVITASSRTADILFGNAGRDTLIARGDNDELYGGAGDDDLVDAYGSTLMDGGAGADRVDYLASSSQRTAGVGVDLAEGMGTGLNVRGEWDSIFDCENVRGTTMPDVLTGDASPNVLDGMGGGDTIIGGAGADTLFGRDGNDTFTANDGVSDLIDGGAGADYAAPDFVVFPFGRTPTDQLTAVEQVGDPRPVVI